jgi:hypothetical protein
MVATPDPARKPISKRLRYEILRRDNHTCCYCGSTAPTVKLTLDHVLPVALGGTDQADNLVAACQDCNAGKSSSHPEQQVIDQVSKDARRWANAVKASAMVLEQERAAVDQYVSDFEEVWDRYSYGGYTQKPIPKEPNWLASIETFQRRGMPITVLISSARIALENRKIDADSTFRYFMGVAWKKLTEIETLAKQVYDNMQGTG